MVRRRINWFKRHLSWTFLLILFSGITLYAVADMVSWYILLRIVAIAIMFEAQIWYLIKKNRSLGWLFLNLLGGVAYAGNLSIGYESSIGLESSMFVAGLIMLCLKNKRSITQPNT